MEGDSRRNALAVWSSQDAAGREEVDCSATTGAFNSARQPIVFGDSGSDRLERLMRTGVTTAQLPAGLGPR